MSICIMPPMFSSCDITGTLGSITLGGDTFIDTLSAGTVIVTLRGATVDNSLGTTVSVGFCGCI